MWLEASFISLKVEVIEHFEQTRESLKSDSIVNERRKSNLIIRCSTRNLIDTNEPTNKSEFSSNLLYNLLTVKKELGKLS
jgi:hypothetical protein